MRAGNAKGNATNAKENVMEEMGQLTMPVSITRVEAHHADGTRATSWSVVQVSVFDGDDGETTQRLLHLHPEKQRIGPSVAVLD